MFYANCAGKSCDVYAIAYSHASAAAAAVTVLCICNRFVFFRLLDDRYNEFVEAPWSVYAATTVTVYIWAYFVVSMFYRFWGYW